MVQLVKTCFLIFIGQQLADAFGAKEHRKLRNLTCISTKTIRQDSEMLRDAKRPHLIFPGGGIFFYWQAGAVTFLRDNGYDLASTSSTGASAGALTATLATNDVDFYEATDLALRIAKDAGVWDRNRGLQGIWGPMIYDWLDEILPADAAARSNKRGLSLLVTKIPSLGTEKICAFDSRKDLIECNMASVHLPWFLDGKLTSSFRDRHYIDGSFLASQRDYHSRRKSSSTLVFDYKEDPFHRSRSLIDAVEALSPKGIHELLEDGKRFAKLLEEQGKLELLSKK
jgi:hypothetical protein